MRNSKGQFVKGHISENKNSMPTNCLFCSKVFLVQPHRFKSGRGKFCSIECRNKGAFTKEVREKMSKIRKGKSTGRGGERCHFWKGGITPQSKKIRMGLKMRKWREKVFGRDNWTCVVCKCRGGKLNADHIKPFSKFPKLRFLLENGRTLCEKCHRETDTYGGKMNKKTYLCTQI